MAVIGVLMRFVVFPAVSACAGRFKFELIFQSHVMARKAPGTQSLRHICGSFVCRPRHGAHAVLSSRCSSITASAVPHARTLAILARGFDLIAKSKMCRVAGCKSRCWYRCVVLWCWLAVQDWV